MTNWWTMVDCIIVYNYFCPPCKTMHPHLLPCDFSVSPVGGVYFPFPLMSGLTT